MTNDEAIYTLKNTAFLGWSEQAEKVSEAVRMAVEALKRETSGDAIDRQAAIRIASGYCHPANVAKELAKLPSVQPERLTDDDFETIRIHLSAFKERLCNQHRWKEAEDYQRLIDRFMAFAERPEPYRKEGE